MREFYKYNACISVVIEVFKSYDYSDCAHIRLWTLTVLNFIMRLIRAYMMT